MATMNSLVSCVQLAERKLNKIKDRLVGKFKSNPTPTVGLLARLKVDLDTVVEFHQEIETTCTEIESNLDKISDAEKRQQVLDFIVDKPLPVSHMPS